MRQPGLRGVTAPMALAVGLVAGLSTAGRAPVEMIHAAGPPDAGGTSPCVATVVRSVGPSLVPTGELVHVGVRMRFDCPPDPRPYHLVVVVDDSRTDGAPVHPLVSVHDVVGQLAVAANPSVRAGLTSFGGKPGVWCIPSNDPRTVATCFASLWRRGAEPALPSDRPWRLAEALDSAGEQLAAASPAAGTDARTQLREGVLIVAEPPESCPAGSPCDPGVECAAARASSDRLVGRGIEVGVVCAGPACAKSCLSDLSVAGSYYLPSAWPEALERQSDLAWSSRLRVSQVIHREVVPSGLVPRPSTFDPAGAVVDESAGTVTWTAKLLSDRTEGSFSYSASVLEPGTYRLDGTTGQLIDTAGRVGRYSVSSRTFVGAAEIIRLFAPSILTVEQRVHP